MDKAYITIVFGAYFQNKGEKCTNIELYDNHYFDILLNICRSSNI